MRLSRLSARPSPGSSAVIVSFREIVIVARVDGPEVSFAIVASTSFDETVVQRQVVPNAVPPVLVLREIIQHYT